MSTTTPARTGRPVRTGRAGSRALRVAGAVAAGLAVWLLAVPVLGVDLVARSGDALLTVGPAAVALAGLAAGLAGWALLALLERLTGSARTIWTVVASGVLVLSLAGPFAQATTTASALVLAAMHLAVGTCLVLALGRTAGPSRRP